CFRHRAAGPIAADRSAAVCRHQIVTAPKSLIVNTPFEAPRFHWVDHHGALKLEEGRRKAGYEIFDPRANTRRNEPLELVERIRARVNEWREADYPGVTTVT